ncbi:MAG TPA: lysophospholipid acyltransferase family protein [Candidatus Sulfotelmatobacter sp.]|nr:lysophospholipid acyltransferase family protein [Candidatus Sulfotelmatobacter sp.]
MWRARTSHLQANWPGTIAGGAPAAGWPWLVGAARRLTAIRDFGLFFGLLAAFGLTCLAWSLLAGLLHRLLPRRLGEPLGQRAIMLIFRGLVGAMQATGICRASFGALDALADAGPLVIAPNHPSLLDAVLIIARLPNVVCAAKAEIWDNPFLGGGARLAGFIRNDSPARLIREAVRQVRGGRHFLIFPEGTRTNGGAIGGFKGGFALIAKQAGVAVQTVFIESNSGFLGKGWPLFRKPQFPLVYRARLGERIAVEGGVRDTVRRLGAYYRQELGVREL